MGTGTFEPTEYAGNKAPLPATGETLPSTVTRKTYRVLTESENAQIQALKDKGEDLLKFLDSLSGTREISLAKTKVEEAIMWGTKSITR